MRVSILRSCGATTAAALVIRLAVACNEYETPDPTPPALTFAASGQPSAALARCGTSTTSSEMLTADGVSSGLLSLSTTDWNDAGSESYQISLSSPGGLVTFVTSGAAGAGDAATGTGPSFTVSAAQPAVSVRLQAGLVPGVAIVDVAYAGHVDDYCLTLSPTAPQSVSLDLVAPAAALPDGWQSVALSAQVLAEDASATSANEAYDWSATGCAYLGAATTRTLIDGGPMSNTLYLPPGWTATAVNVAAEPSGASVERTLCLTPFGAYDLADAGPDACVAATGADGAAPTDAQASIVCPVRDE